MATRILVFMRRCSLLLLLLGRERTDVVDQVPALIFVEGVGEAGHGFSALGDFPKELAIGFVADVGGTEVGRRVGKIGGFGPVAFAAVSVTGGALLGVDCFAGGEGLCGGRDGI